MIHKDLIIAIDPSLNSTGLCILPVGENTPIAYLTIRPPVGDPHRLKYIYDYYRMVFDTYNQDIRYIAYESQMHQMRYGYQSGTILELAENIGILKLSILSTKFIYPNVSIVRVNPDIIKEYATGSKKATKEDMMDHVDQRHMKSIKSSIPESSVNDVSDAYHLARMVNNRISEDTISDILYEGWF